MNFKPNKRKLAKSATFFMTYVAAANATEATIHHTIDDDIVESHEGTVDVVSMLTGWFVAAKAKPLTDKAVDYVADRRAARKACKKLQQEKPLSAVA